MSCSAKDKTLYSRALTVRTQLARKSVRSSRKRNRRPNVVCSYAIWKIRLSPTVAINSTYSRPNIERNLRARCFCAPPPPVHTTYNCKTAKSPKVVNRLHERPEQQPTWPTNLPVRESWQIRAHTCITLWILQACAALFWFRV